MRTACCFLMFFLASICSGDKFTVKVNPSGPDWNSATEKGRRKSTQANAIEK